MACLCPGPVVMIIRPCFLGNLANIQANLYKKARFPATSRLQLSSFISSSYLDISFLDLALEPGSVGIASFKSVN